MVINSRRSVATVAASIVLGIGVGVVATLGVAAVSAELENSPFGGTEPGATRWHCDGAEAIAVATLDDGTVHVHVMLTDHKRRQWELRPTPYFGGAELAPRSDGSYPVIDVPDGDRDGGSTRSVSVRVVTEDEWCTSTVSLVEASSLEQ